MVALDGPEIASTEVLTDPLDVGVGDRVVEDELGPTNTECLSHLVLKVWAFTGHDSLHPEMVATSASSSGDHTRHLGSRPDTRVLGLSVAADRRDHPQPYVAVQRDGVRIGAAGRQDQGNRESRRPRTGVELVLEVDDLADELERVQRADWPLVEDLQARPWGLRDFRLLDPSGYYLRISERRAATSVGQHPPSR